MPPTAFHLIAPRPRTPLTGAVAAPSLAAVAGAMRPVRVLSSGPYGCYLQLEESPDVLPVLDARAVPLPTAVRLAAGAESRWPATGSTGTIGRHTIDLPDLRVRITRTWRPARVEWMRPDGAPSAQLVEPLLDLLDDAQLALVDDTAAALHDPTRVDRLIGRGAGTTPSGDDALAGALLLSRGYGGHPALAAAVRRGMHCTTAVSRALLAAAIDGYAVAAVVALVDALSSDAPSARKATEVHRHAVEVARFGHSSGRDLIAGLVATARWVEERRTALSDEALPNVPPDERDVA